MFTWLSVFVDLHPYLSSNSYLKQNFSNQGEKDRNILEKIDNKREMCVKIN